MVKKESKSVYSFTAEVERKNSKQVHIYGFVRILFRNIRLNGNLLFRDHVWVAETKKLKSLKIGDVVHFRATIKKYIDSNNITQHKLGFGGLKDVKILANYKRFKPNNKPYIDNIWMKRKIRKLK